jgi:hypothetical protein
MVRLHPLYDEVSLTAPAKMNEREVVGTPEGTTAAFGCPAAWLALLVQAPRETAATTTSGTSERFTWTEATP